jgi:hypothetical protein
MFFSKLTFEPIWPTELLSQTGPALQKNVQTHGAIFGKYFGKNISKLNINGKTSVHNAAQFLFFRLGGGGGDYRQVHLSQTQSAKIFWFVAHDR